MRRKIREIMNKEEGFTLVELLAVLAILVIIVAIAIPAVGSVISNSEAKAIKAETELVIDAARLYDIENDIRVGPETEGATNGVDVSTLIKEGYLELRDREGKTPLSGKVYKIKNTGNEDEVPSFSYEYTHPDATE